MIFIQKCGIVLNANLFALELSFVADRPDKTGVLQIGLLRKREYMSEVFHIAEHTLIENLSLIPFLFLTYLLMEYWEHRAGDKAHLLLKRSGRFAPILGAVTGAVPQCGFSTAAANLYAGRMISMGTLIAIYLSTSDEMLPIMISEKVAPSFILLVLGLKVLIGALAGVLIDTLCRPKQDGHHHIHEMCEEENCHCEKGIWYSSLVHTLRITIFILVISFVLNLVMHTVGEEALGNLVLQKPVLGSAVAGMIGLIPNCASSVVLTQLFIKGAMDFGAMMAGLLVNAGVGVLVLFRVNHNRKENLQIIGLLYGIGVVTGIFIGLLGVV